MRNPKLWIARHSIAFAGLALSISACGGTSETTSTPSSPDATADAVGETGPDAGPEAGPDAPFEAAFEAGPDAQPDVLPDVQPDAPLVCNAPQADCDQDVSNGCESDLATNPKHCGSCSHECTAGGHQQSSCQAGSCVVTCEPTFSDCNGKADDGCEIDINDDDGNCGGCAVACDVAHHAKCVGGVCTSACPPGSGWADCDGDASNGCESDLMTEPGHCGTCLAGCKAPANGTATCSAGSCGFACQSGFDDCDADPANGCESQLAKDPSNCGKCGTTCGGQNGTPGCQAGACTLACSAGWSDCDGDLSNGCEVDVTTSLQNCGGCGHDCGTPANGTAACVKSACQVTCAPGYHDCNGEPGDGCESEATCPTVQIASIPSGVNIAVEGNVMYALSHGGGVYRVALPGPSTPELLYQEAGAVIDIRIVGDDLYWGSYNGTIYKAPKSGAGPVTTVASSVPSPGGLLIDGDTLYWSVYWATIEVYSQPLAGGSVSKIGTLPGQQWSSTLLRLSNGDFLVGGQTTNALWRIPKDGAAATIEYDLQGRISTQIAETQDAYYVATYSSEVLRVDKATKTVTTAATGYSIFGVAVQDQMIYWSSYFGGGVYSQHL